MDYIRGDISWDINHKCVSCPDQDCLIYIYNFYYNFLLSVTDGISVIDKLYILIICEARICILSKCLCLESIRVQDKRTDLVESLLDAVYEEDSSKNRLLPEPSEKYSQMFEKVQKNQVGAGSDALQGQPQQPQQPQQSQQGIDEAEAIKLGKELGETETRERLATDEARDITEKATEFANEAGEREREAEEQAGVAIKARDEAMQLEKVAEGREQNEAAQLEQSQRDLEEKNKLAELEAKQIVADKAQIVKEEATIQELQGKLSECETREKDLQGQNQELQSELEKYGNTSLNNQLLSDLTIKLIASFTEESRVSGIKELILLKEPGFQSEGDNDKVAEKFMELYFPIIRVALTPHAGGANPEPYLRLYGDNYGLFEFIEPSIIASEVYGVDPSEGYLDEMFQVLKGLPKNKDTTRDAVRMMPCILLHQDNTDEYPLGKLHDDYLMAPILQSMIPTLRKNPNVFAKLLVSMKKDDSLRDALKFGDMYLFKDVSEKFPGIKEIFEELVRIDKLKQSETSEGLSPGVDRSHCDQTMDRMLGSLRHKMKTPISSKDLTYLTQCEKEKKIKGDYDTINY
jgi:chemotaxis protein histidine kinase CheA